DADAVAGNARLRDFEQRGADAIAVADRRLGIREAVHRKVFSELSVGKIVAGEFAFPVPVGIQLIDHHGAIRAAMAAQISLTVAVEIEPSNLYPARDRTFPDSGVDGLSAPRNIAREPDVNRYKPCCQCSSRAHVRLTILDVRRGQIDQSES